MERYDYKKHVTDDLYNYFMDDMDERKIDFGWQTHHTTMIAKIGSFAFVKTTQ